MTAVFADSTFLLQNTTKCNAFRNLYKNKKPLWYWPYQRGFSLLIDGDTAQAVYYMQLFEKSQAFSSSFFFFIIYASIFGSAQPSRLV